MKSRPVRIGDRIRKPHGSVAVGSVDGGFHSSVFTVSELPKRQPPGWSLHGLWLDRLTHEDLSAITPPDCECAEPFAPVSRLTYLTWRALAYCPPDLAAALREELEAVA